MCDIYQRREAALQYHKEEYERVHVLDKATVVASNTMLDGEDQID